MRIFNPRLAEGVTTFTPDGEQMTLVFCSPKCKIDWRTSATRYPSVADRNVYGCWQCGEDLLQGLNLSRPKGDNNVYRINRTGRL